MDEEQSRYKVEEDKMLIYDTKTNKDICMYFDEETKLQLLHILNFFGLENK